jgi:(2Fe-2S) ferredoxin
MLPHGAKDQIAQNKMLGKLNTLVKDFIEIDMAKTEPELLMKMDDSGVLVDDSEKMFYTNHKDEILSTLKETLEDGEYGLLASEIDVALKDADTYLKARLFQGLESKDAGGSVRNRVGQMVPFVPVYKNPIVFRDVNNNDARTIIESVQASPRATVSDPEAFARVVERFIAMKGMDEDSGSEKLFQRALEEEGFDAAQYVNHGEGVGNKVSLVLFNEKNIKPLHELIPSLGKLKEALRQKVYDLMAMGVPMSMAIEYVTGTDDNDQST